MRFIEKTIKKSKKFMIIKTTDLTDNEFWYGVYEIGGILDKTLGRLFGLYPTQVKSPLSKSKAEKIFNNMVNYYEVK